MASNSAPTEYTTYATEGKVLVNKKWVADMTDSMNTWDHAKDMNDLLSKPFVINGKTYGVPVDGYVMTITLNKKLFKEKGVELPPIDWTWDDLLDAARKISDPAKGIAGFIPMGKGPEAGWNWTNFLYAAGGDVQKLDNGKVVGQFNSEAGLKALEFYKKLKDENLIPQNWALGYGDALNAFSQGRGAMVMCGSGNAADTAINEGGISKDDLVVYPIPSLTKGGKHSRVFWVGTTASLTLKPTSKPNKRRSNGSQMNTSQKNSSALLKKKSKIEKAKIAYTFPNRSITGMTLRTLVKNTPACSPNTITFSNMIRNCSAYGMENPKLNTRHKSSTRKWPMSFRKSSPPKMSI